MKLRINMIASMPNKLITSPISHCTMQILLVVHLLRSKHGFQAAHRAVMIPGSLEAQKMVMIYS